MLLVLGPECPRPISAAQATAERMHPCNLKLALYTWTAAQHLHMHDISTGKNYVATLILVIHAPMLVITVCFSVYIQCIHEAVLDV